MRILASAVLVSLLPAGIALGDDGCAPGTVSIVVAPDAQSASLLFSDFVSTAGGLTGLITDTSACNLPIPFGDLDGFAVYSLDYRGFVQAADGQRAELVDLATGTTIAGVDGPAAGDLTGVQVVATTPGNALVINTALNVDAGINPDEVQAGIDSLDVARIGFTTQASVQASVDRLATARSGIVAHLSGGADLLLGALEPHRRPSEVSALAALGSPMLGATGHLAVTEGFSVSAGAAGFDLAGPGFDAEGALFAGAARYSYSLDADIDLFAEASVWGAPNLGARFTRDYLNNGATVSGVGQSNGSLLALSGRLGVAFHPNPDNQIVVAGSFARNWLSLSGYAEGTGGGNLFAATVAGRTTTGDLGKLTAAWTTQIASEVELTVTGAIGRLSGSPDAVAANIAYVGPITGAARDLTFVEYGARLGWNFTPEASLSGFAFGTTGDGIGTQLRFGGSLNVGF